MQTAPAASDRLWAFPARVRRATASPLRGTHRVSRPEFAYENRRSLPIAQIAGGMMIVGLGVLIGQMIAAPNKRVIEACIGLILLGMSVRYPLFWSLAALTVISMFPVGLSVGSTNVLAVLVLTCIWLARMSLGEYRPQLKTGMEAPIILLLTAYMISFLSISSGSVLMQGISNFSIMLGCVGFFYLIVNFVETDAQLEIVVRFMLLGAFLMMLTVMFQIAFPGKALIPQWIIPEDTNIKAYHEGFRAGGAFNSHDLLSDYCAAIMCLEVLMFVREKTLRGRLAYAVLMLMTLIAQLATANRGGLLSLLVGLAYLGFRVRRNVKIVPVVTTLLLGAVSLWTISILLSEHTIVASLFKRVSETKFIGLVPDTRVGIWSAAFDRAMERPWIGWGPYYNIQRTVAAIYWPHNGFIFAFYITGILGAVALAWVVLSTVLISHRDAGNSLNDARFSRSLMVALHVMVVQFLVSQMRTDYQRDATYMFYAWLLFGLTAASHLVVQRNRRTE